MIKILRVTANPVSLPEGGRADLVVELTATEISDEGFIQLQVGVKQGDNFLYDHGFQRPTGSITEEMVSSLVFVDHDIRKCYGDSWVAVAAIYSRRLPNGILEELVDQMKVDPIYEVL